MRVVSWRRHCAHMGRRVLFLCAQAVSPGYPVAVPSTASFVSPPSGQPSHHHWVVLPCSLHEEAHSRGRASAEADPEPRLRCCPARAVACHHGCLRCAKAPFPRFRSVSSQPLNPVLCVCVCVVCCVLCELGRERQDHPARCTRWSAEDGHPHRAHPRQRATAR